MYFDDAGTGSCRKYFFNLLYDSIFLMRNYMVDLRNVLEDIKNLSKELYAVTGAYIVLFFCVLLLFLGMVCVLFAMTYIYAHMLSGSLFLLGILFIPLPYCIKAFLYCVMFLIGLCVVSTLWEMFKYPSRIMELPELIYDSLDPTKTHFYKNVISPHVTQEPVYYSGEARRMYAPSQGPAGNDLG